MELDKLEEKDYLNKSYDFWKEYRLKLTKNLKENDIKVEKD